MVNDVLKVSMVLISYNRHEPNMFMRWFWDLFLAGTITPPQCKNPFAGSCTRGGVLY